MCARTVRDTGRRSFPSSARALINARRPHAQPLAAREEVLVGESESAPFPLTRRVPFRHDVPNGEQRQIWDTHPPSTPPSSSSGRWSFTASAGARTRSSPASRAATRAAYRLGQEGGRRGRGARPEPLPDGRGAAQAEARERPPEDRERDTFKSRRLLRQPSAVGPAAKGVKFAFISANEGSWRVSDMCPALGVTRQGHYAWRRRGPSARVLAPV